MSDLHVGSHSFDSLEAQAYNEDEIILMVASTLWYFLLQV